MEILHVSFKPILAWPGNELKVIRTQVSCNPEAEMVVLQFLQQYFQLYDGDRREQLLEAYHEDAVMSMSVAYPSYHTHEVRACNTLKRYLTVGSRNLVC